MNDEASVHYTATIDQMSEGLVWLKEQFGGPHYNPPTIAWQVNTLLDTRHKTGDTRHKTQDTRHSQNIPKHDLKCDTTPLVCSCYKSDTNKFSDRSVWTQFSTRSPQRTDGNERIVFRKDALSRLR